MNINYEARNKLKIDKQSNENSTCPNCKFVGNLSYAREEVSLSLFYIPIFRTTRRWILLCPNCGMGKEYTKKEYKKII